MLVEGPDGAWEQISPGGSLVLPAFESEGEHQVAWFAVDVLGNAEEVHRLTVRLDRSGPTVTGLPAQPCLIWPPNQARRDSAWKPSPMNQQVTNRHSGGQITVRAARDGENDGRLYTVTALAADLAGNQTVARGTTSALSRWGLQAQVCPWPDLLDDVEAMDEVAVVSVDQSLSG